MEVAPELSNVCSETMMKLWMAFFLYLLVVFTVQHWFYALYDHYLGKKPIYKYLFIHIYFSNFVTAGVQLHKKFRANSEVGIFRAQILIKQKKRGNYVLLISFVKFKSCLYLREKARG